MNESHESLGEIQSEPIVTAGMVREALAHEPLDVKHNPLRRCLWLANRLTAALQNPDHVCTCCGVTLGGENVAQAGWVVALRDEVSGLEWSATCCEPGTDKPAPLVYKQAEAVARLAGNGWRIPTIRELITLIDYDKPAPGNLSKIPAEASWYASSTMAADYSHATYAVDFRYGLVAVRHTASPSHLRLVRNIKGNSHE